MRKLVLLLFAITLLNGVTFGSPTQQRESLAWDAPTTNADGSQLTDLEGYYIYWSFESGSYSDAQRYQVADSAKASILFSEITTLANPNGLYFAVTAYDAEGNESDYSNEVQNVPLGIPAAPDNLVIL